MTIAEIIKDVLDKTIDPNGHVASYAIRQGGKPVGYLEARLDNGTSCAPMQRKLRWVLSRPTGGQPINESSEDLRPLLAKFGEVEVVPARGADTGWGGG